MSSSAYMRLVQAFSEILIRLCTDMPILPMVALSLTLSYALGGSGSMIPASLDQMANMALPYLSAWCLISAAIGYRAARRGISNPYLALGWSYVYLLVTFVILSLIESVVLPSTPPSAIPLSYRIIVDGLGLSLAAPLLPLILVDQGLGRMASGLLIISSFCLLLLLFWTCRLTYQFGTRRINKSIA